MPPKGKKVATEGHTERKKARTKNPGVSSSAPPPPPPYDATLWRSAAHERRFREHTMSRAVVRERAIIIGQSEYAEVREPLMKRKWERFGLRMSKSNRTICKEFYANAYRLEDEDKDIRVSYVRGKKVKYDARTIQRVLKTAFDGDDCQFKRNLANIEVPPRRGTPGYATWSKMEQAKPVLQKITKVGESWVPTADGTNPRLVNLRQLNGLASVWYHFVVSNVMPCSNQSEVIMSRAVLIYTIMMGENINLPKILSDSIYEMAHPISSSAALGHSCLIQRLCERAGVEIPLLDDLRDEVQLHPTIDAKFIATQLRIGGEGHERLAPGRKKMSDSGEGTSRGPAAHTPDIRQWIMTVEKRMRFHRRRLHFMHHSIQSFQRQMWSMQAACCEAQGIEPNEYHYHLYPDSEEEDALDLEVEQMLRGSAAPSQTGDDTEHATYAAADADGGEDPVGDADRDDHVSGEDEPYYSPMEQDHGSHSAVSAVPPLALYDPAVMHADDAEEEEEDPEEDTD